MRIGSAVDVHPLVPGRPLVLGGVEIPHTHGPEGHSDGDALSHAIANAMLGALALGDLGDHFPSSDPSLKGISSLEILSEVARKIEASGYRVSNLDSTLVIQAPRIAPHREKIRGSIASRLGLDLDRVSVKAATTDRLGFLGRREGLAAFATVLLEPRS